MFGQQAIKVRSVDAGGGGRAGHVLIAPFEQAREEARQLVEKHGRFLLVHVATPLEVAEQRDVKGLYAKARAGELPNFTGIDSPYEAPEHPELWIDTTELSAEAAAEKVVAAILEFERR